MTSARGDFAHYLPRRGDCALWGVDVLAAGCITNAPGEAYPPAGHPPDHSFLWERGRVLGAWQAILITQGAGEFQAARRSAPEAVAPGDLLWLTPGQWHRYRPIPRAGWVELWIELHGPVLVRLTEAGWLPAQNALRRGLPIRQLTDVIRQLHLGLDGGEPFDRAAGALRLLGLLSRPENRGAHPVLQAVRAAERVMAERMDHPLHMPTLARELGVGYAVFRREFKRRTGVAPRQYLLQLRLERAQRLLGSTPAKLEDVAQQLGFSSGFHLSAAFKARFGVSPAAWRQGGRLTSNLY